MMALGYEERRYWAIDRAISVQDFQPPSTARTVCLKQHCLFIARCTAKRDIAAIPRFAL